MLRKNPDTLVRSFEAKRVQKNYAQVAWFYNVWGRFTEIKAMRTALTLAEIQDEEQILEVAAGTGLFFEELLKRNPDGRNVGLDLSPEMLNQARRRFRKTNLQPAFVLGSARDLPFRSDQYDLLINNYMLDLLPEETFRGILSEFKRVLAPGGRVVITTMAFGEKWFNGFWRGVAKWAPGVLTGCRPVSFAPFLQDAGFSNIKVVSISQNTVPSEVLRAVLI